MAKKAQSKASPKAAPARSSGTSSSGGKRIAPRRSRPAARRSVRCYLCGSRFEVSSKTMSTPCPTCNRALKVEDVVVKSYLPVNDLQTCGRITITKRGRVAAKRIQAGDGIVCEGSMEGTVETDGEVTLGPKASWKGQTLQSRKLNIAVGASLRGHIVVPWRREGEDGEGE